MVKLEALQWTTYSRMYWKEEQVVSHSEECKTHCPIRAKMIKTSHRPLLTSCPHPLFFQFWFCTLSRLSIIRLKSTHQALLNMEGWKRLHIEMSLQFLIGTKLSHLIQTVAKCALYARHHSTRVAVKTCICFYRVSFCFHILKSFMKKVKQGIW